MALQLVFLCFCIICYFLLLWLVFPCFAHRRGGGLFLAGGASWPLVVLLGGRRCLPVERCPCRLGVEGPGTASSGCCWGSSCSAGVALGAEGWLLGPPPVAVDEVLGSSSLVDLDRLLEVAGLGVRCPSCVPSCSLAARAPCLSRRRLVSLLPKSAVPNVSSRSRWYKDCRVWKSTGWSCSELSRFGVQKLFTEPIGTTAAARRWKRRVAGWLSALLAWWTTADDASDGVMTCST